jgi:hypothetical protein
MSLFQSSATIGENTEFLGEARGEFEMMSCSEHNSFFLLRFTALELIHTHIRRWEKL